MAADGADGLRAAAVSLDAVAIESARLGFHRAFPHRSAKRPFYLTQLLVIVGLTTALVWALRQDAALTFSILRFVALVLFAAAIVWRLAGAALLGPTLSRLAAPAHWPTYTILCPLYREANIAPDLIAALDRLDYPGT